MSAEAALTAGAVLAGDDPSGGGWYNPAALGGIRRSSFQLGASAYSVATVSVEGALVTVLPPGWGPMNGTARDTHYVSVPSVLSLSYRVREGLGVAVGVWTPYHDTYSATLVGSSSGPYPGDPALQATYEQIYGLSYRWDDTWAGASVGWQALPTIRVGASLQGAYSSSTSVIDLDTGLQTTSTNPRDQGAIINVSIRDDQSILAARALVGVQWDVTEALRLALAVRSPSVRAVAWGQTTRVTSVSVLLPGYDIQQSQGIEEIEPSAGLSVIDVGRVYGGAAWSSGRWSVRLEGDWGPALRRNRNAETANWSARTGATYQWSPDLRVGAGLFRDGARSQASDGTLALDTYGLAGGVDYRPAKVVEALGGGDSWDLITGIAVRCAYGVGKGPGMTVVPFDYASSVLPILPGLQEQEFQEVPAHSLGGSIDFFTALKF